MKIRHSAVLLAAFIWQRSVSVARHTTKMMADEAYDDGYSLKTRQAKKTFWKTTRQQSVSLVYVMVLLEIRKQDRNLPCETKRYWMSRRATPEG